MSQIDNATFLVNELLFELGGARIDDMSTAEAGGVNFPILHITTRKGRQLFVVVQSDPEGNDCGWLRVLNEEDA